MPADHFELELQLALPKMSSLITHPGSLHNHTSQFLKRDKHMVLHLQGELAVPSPEESQVLVGWASVILTGEKSLLHPRL